MVNSEDIPQHDGGLEGLAALSQAEREGKSHLACHGDKIGLLYTLPAQAPKQKQQSVKN